MTPETLELLQTKIAFLERASNELSDVVFLQQREIESLANQIKGLAERLRGVQSGDDSNATDEERPPHY